MLKASKHETHLKMRLPLRVVKDDDVDRLHWRMPWLLTAMKDVISCDKLREGANDHYTRRFPNGETHHDEVVISERKQTR